MLLMLAFVFVPALMTFWISLHRWSMFTPMSEMQWVGWQNYSKVFSSDTHRTALWNTILYVGLSVLLTLPLSVALALLLYMPKLRGSGTVRTLLFSTYVIPAVAICIIWSQLYTPTSGPIDQILAAVGLGSPGWLSNPAAALSSLVIFNVWQMLGYYVVLLVAGLTQVPHEVMESAQVDGANTLSKIFRIILPLIRPSMFFVVLMTVVNSIQVFDPVYLLTQGGPADSTLVASFDIQRTAFQNGLAGEASAMAFSLLCLVVGVGAILGLTGRRS